ncbi:MAG: glycosyltransferase family 2 protein [Acidobacteria bacterium]|nr:glycosyltransferase family 2 protein [Acidobacteriota bacterium]
MDPIQPDQQDAAMHVPTGPRVTVIIASFHRGAVLRRCLDALHKAAKPELLQVITLDLGNHDTTPAWDLDYPHFTFLRLSRNFGCSKALNIGIRSAKGELLFFLDPAVEITADAILSLAGKLDEIPDAGALSPLLTDPSGEPIPQVRSLPDRDTLWRAWQDESAYAASLPAAGNTPFAVEHPGRKALLIPLPFLKGMHYFDERYGDWGGDLELSYQIRHASRKPYIIPAIRAVDHSSTERQLVWSNGQLATIAADRLNGVAHFLGKRAGFFAETIFRIQAILVTLFRVITFQNAGYSFSLLSALTGGQKIDGSQGTL